LTYRDNGLGARGIDVVLQYNSTPSLTSTVFPIYDAHGNQVVELSRNGSSYSLGTERVYNAWGGIRSGGTTGAPDRRYCANLGHTQDDETDLIYMRARYYDFTRGRFINEDPARDGANWFTYCGNDPANRADASGKSWRSIVAGGLAGVGMLYACLALAMMWGNCGNFSSDAYRFDLVNACANVSALFFAASLMALDPQGMTGVALKALGIAVAAHKAVIAVMTIGAEAGAKTRAANATGAVYVYGLILIGAIVAIDAEAML
jgi:RHS repeat-associated protein